MTTFTATLIVVAVASTFSDLIYDLLWEITSIAMIVDNYEIKRVYEYQKMFNG